MAGIAQIGTGNGVRSACQCRPRTALTCGFPLPRQRILERAVRPDDALPEGSGVRDADPAERPVGPAEHLVRGRPVNAPARVVTTAALRQQVLRLLPTAGSARPGRRARWSTPRRCCGPRPRHIAASATSRSSAGRSGCASASITPTGASATRRPTPRPTPASLTRDPTRARPPSAPTTTGTPSSDTGPVTITLTVAWRTEFSLDNGATWTAVDPAPLTGPATTHDLAVVQARGILVQNP